MQSAVGIFSVTFQAPSRQQKEVAARDLPSLTPWEPVPLFIAHNFLEPLIICVGLMKISLTPSLPSAMAAQCRGAHSQG